MVARSRRATGPFEVRRLVAGQPSRPILVANERWRAPGHNSVVTDAAGHDWLAYHAISVRQKTFNAVNEEQQDTRRVLLLDRLEYVDGWPCLVASHGTPSATPQPAPE